jgi:hypothetical protein
MVLVETDVPIIVVILSIVLHIVLHMHFFLGVVKESN